MEGGWEAEGCSEAAGPWSRWKGRAQLRHGGIETRQMGRGDAGSERDIAACRKGHGDEEVFRAGGGLVRVLCMFCGWTCNTCVFL